VVEKIVVAPQIVIYRGIFKDSSGLINTLSQDNPNSLFSPMRKWYEQGLRKEAEMTDSLYSKDILDPFALIEQNYLKEFMDIVHFIQKDYFNQFSGTNGIWPDFIEDWDQLTNPKSLLYVDFFKYDYTKISNNETTGILMDYHVDEFLMPNDKKSKRHVITINLYLNDDYSGGEICAYDSVSNKIYSFKPSPGDIVVMPSLDPFYHAVNNTYNADRYFLRTFIDYDLVQKDTYSKEELDGMVDGMDKVEQDYVKSHLQSIKLMLNNGIEVRHV
jgi:hypothetical protein